MATLVPIEQWFRTLDRNLSSCVLKDGVKHELSAPWLSASSSSSNIGLQAHTSAKSFANERVRKASILRQRPPDIQEVLAAIPSPEKKNVRFADSLGHQLEAVKYFINSPKVMRRHTVTLAPDINNLYTNGKSHLIPTNFTVPSLDPGFWDRLKSQSVLFHSCTTSETTVYGIVSVIDHSYVKKVYVRYTFNDWNSHVEQECSYIAGSHQNDNDKFTFEIYCKPSDFTLSSPNLFHPRLFFAIRYKSGNGNEYWDNNFGKNYCLNYITS